MMSFEEFEGKSIDSAVQKACDRLHISRDRIQYDVLSYGSTGIFGLVGAKNAKIRVVVESAGRADVADPERVSDASADETLPPETTKDDTDGSDGSDETDNDGIAETGPSADREPLDPMVLEAAAAEGKAALEKIVAAITDDADVSVDIRSDRILFDVAGGNSGMVIGKRGQTLEAIQYLVDKVVNRNHQERVRLQIDVEGYMKNRRANLRELASRMAEKSKRTGKPVTIGQMSAHDRRIVHLALKDDRGVRTQSQGDGFYRKLIIFPKKTNSRKRRHRPQRSG